MNNGYSVEAILKATGADKFASDFEKAGKSLGGLTGSTKKATGGVKSFMGGVGKLAGAIGITKLVSAGFSAIRSSVDGAVSRVDTLNQFPKVLQQMGASGEDADRSIARLSDGIQGLPTTLDGVASTAQRMFTILGDIDLATESTLALNNAFLASGASQADASRGLEQYTQMLSAGKVDMQSWRTLQETMPYALKETAEAFGFTGQSATNDFYAALQSGEVTMDEMNAKIIELSTETGGFAETALEASKGLATSWQNIKTAIVTGVANVIQAINEWMEDSGLGGIAENFDKVKVAVQTAFGSIVENVPIVLDKITELYNTITNSTAFQTMRDVIQQVIDKGQELISAVLESEAWANFKSLMADVAQAILDIDFSQVLQDVSEFIDKWSPLIAGILGAVAAFKIITGVIAAVTAVKAALSVASGVLAGAIAFLTSPIGLVVAAIGAIIAIGVLLYKNWDTIKAKAQDLGNKIKTIFNSMKTAVSNAINNVKTAISNGLNKAYTTVTDFFGKFLNAGANIVGNIAKGITGAIGKVTGAVKGVLKKARNLLPFSPPKDKSSPMVGLEKNGIVENIAQGIMNNEGEIQRAMNRALDVDMPMVNGHVSHEMNNNLSIQPAYINVNIGGQNFRGFVENITNAQDKNVNLELSYL